MWLDLCFARFTMQKCREWIREKQDRLTWWAIWNLLHAPEPWTLTSAQIPTTITQNLGHCNLDYWPSSLRAWLKQNHFSITLVLPSSCQPILKVPAGLSSKPTWAYATKEEAVLFYLTLFLNNAFKTSSIIPRDKCLWKPGKANEVIFTIALAVRHSLSEDRQQLSIRAGTLTTQKCQGSPENLWKKRNLERATIWGIHSGELAPKQNSGPSTTKEQMWLGVNNPHREGAKNKKIKKGLRQISI